MEAAGPDLLDIVRALLGGGRPGLAVAERPLRGGLECAVSVATARWREPGGARGRLELVLKRARGIAAREADVYAAMAAAGVRLAPALLGVHRGAEGVTLVLERVRRVEAWPWRELDAAASVLEAVSRLHALPPAALALPAWDYEEALRASADSTLAAVELYRRDPSLAVGRWSLGPLRRTVEGLGSLRRELLSSAALPLAPLHGDLHSGNALLAARGRVVLLDWGRARVGSPLEDVSSWLQSLAWWEPVARAGHDTLLARYLAARGLDPLATAGLRAPYWMAGASNALAGALRYHVEVAVSRDAPPRSRARSAAAARDWLRIVRRADALFSEGGARRRPPRSAGVGGELEVAPIVE